MQSQSRDIKIFEAVACEEPALKWYAIADSAQHKALPNAILSGRHEFRNLLRLENYSQAALHSPYLVELCTPDYSDGAWSWINLHSASTPCFSIIATFKSFNELYDQLVACTQVALPDKEIVFFAFWDGVILGTLVGQTDDLTLHVPGPVLSLEQQENLKSGVSKWWYWDRHSTLRTIDIRLCKDIFQPSQLILSQKQVDDLVEASVPDHVLSYLELNQSSLISEIASSERYDLVRNALVVARDIGLTSMRDLVDFVCLKLFYKEKLFRDVAIVHLLDMVKTGHIKFRDALSALP